MTIVKDKNVSTLFPQLHPNNIAELKSAVRFFGEVYFHGDGNIYPKKSDSDDRIMYRNDHPVNFGGGYRMYFDKTTAIPANLADMETALVNAMNKEKSENQTAEKVRSSSNPNALPAGVHEDDVADEGAGAGDPAGTGDPDINKGTGKPAKLAKDPK